MNDATQFFDTTAGAAGYEIERSLRFNSSDSAYLSRTPASAGNRKTWTWAGWVKRSGTTTDWLPLFQAYDGSSFAESNFLQLTIYLDQIGIATNTVWLRRTQAVYRDYSAWMHVVCAFDTTQATGSDRVKIYVNGSQVTAFALSSDPTQNADYGINRAVAHQIGQRYGGQYFSGYLADIHFIDGQALDPTSFGEFDTNGVWQPKAYTGSYGTNGFHLPFSDNSTAAALGTDTSGNGNDWTVNNLSVNEVNYANATTNAVNGVIPNGGDPYWIDFLPTNADLDYTAGTTGMQRVHDGSTSTNVYWVGDQYSIGNVLRARFDLRDYPTITSLRVYGGFTGYTPYNYQLLDSSKTPISGTSGSFGSIGWHSLTISGSPRYLEISCTSGSSRRLRLYAIEVNGTVLVNGTPANNDSFFDSPTNGTQTDTGAGGEVSGNYATWNPLKEKTGGYTMSYADGNLELSGGGDGVGTFPFGSGKKYFELTIKSASAFSQGYYGIVDINQGVPRAWTTSEIAAFRDTGTLYGNGSTGAAPAASQVGDVIGFAVDVDNQKLFISINGTYLNSADPAAGTGFSFSGRDFSNYAPLASLDAGNTQVIVLNAGQRPFAYPAPSGYKALCTTNLPDPTIADGSDYFDVSLWDGNSGTTTISGLEFSPDWAWLKSRSTATYAILQDTVRGYDKALYLGGVAGDDAEATITDSVTSFNSDGYTLGSRSIINYTGRTYVGWAWDAGSSTVSNTDGSITSQVRANQTAGFSIVSYTGVTGNQSFGHGLNVKPKLIIIKNRSNAANWFVMIDIGTTYYKYGHLNTTDVFYDATAQPVSSTTVTLGNNNAWFGANGDNYVAYCFAPVDGYSAMGSYVGNGQTSGVFVYTGFRPRWILIKKSSATSSWYILDTARDTYNQSGLYLYSDLSNAERDYRSTYPWDILSNGFIPRAASGSVINDNGATYVWVAFAESPFQYARAR